MKKTMFFGAVLSLNFVQASDGYWRDPSNTSANTWNSCGFEIPYVDSVESSKPESRLSSFVKPKKDGSMLKRDDRHITDQERELLEKLEAERQNSANPQ